jgi:sodium/pantothenate symporter
MDIYVAGVVASFLLYIVVGNYAGRKVKHLDDYFVAGRQAPTLLIVGTLVASVNSTGAFLGEAGFSYSGFTGYFLLGLPLTSIGYALGAVFFGRYLRRSRVLTVAEFFGRRFFSQRVRTAAGVTLILGLLGYLMVVTHGVALVLGQIIGLPHWAGLLAAWLSYTMFTLYAGSRGVVITDTIMFLLFTAVSVAALYFIISFSGGWFSTIEGLSTLASKPDIMSWHGTIGPTSEWNSEWEAFAWSSTLNLAWGVAVAVSPWQSSRYLMAKDEHVVMRSACFATIILIFFQYIVYYAGGAINLANPDIEPTSGAMLWAAYNMMPAIAGAILLAGILAAGLSSATTFLSLIGFSVTNDVFQFRERSDEAMLSLSRITMFVVGVVALLMAFLTPPNIFWITWSVGTIFASSWGPVAFMSIWTDKITADGAFWGIVSGFLGNALSALLDAGGYIDLPGYMDPVLVGALISVVVILVVSSRGSSTDAERALRKELHVVPAQELSVARTRNTLRATKMIVWGGILTPVLMLLLIVRPYQQAKGLLDPGGVLIWNTGEVILPLCGGVVLIVSGLITHHFIKISYSPDQ